MAIIQKVRIFSEEIVILHRLNNQRIRPCHVFRKPERLWDIGSECWILIVSRYLKGLCVKCRNCTHITGCLRGGEWSTKCRESKGLAPGKSRGDEVAAGGDHPSLEIQSDHLVEGQEIEFEANIKSN